MNNLNRYTREATNETVGRLQNVRDIIFDCDGVLIESIRPKTDLFVDLLPALSDRQEEAVRELHGSNPGMHRSDVFRHAHEEILGESVSADQITALCDVFNQRVTDMMSDIPLVEGVQSFLERNRHRFRYHVVSGAPEDELKTLLERLGIASYFSNISGSPPGKPERAQDIVQASERPRDVFLVVGDAEQDLAMAERVDVPMIFRPSTDRVRLKSPYIAGEIADLNGLQSLIDDAS